MFKNYENVKLISKKSLIAKKKLKIQDVGAFMKAESGATFTSSGGTSFSKNVFLKPYNPIDLTP